MLVKNMVLELLLPLHEAMINSRILRASANNGCMRVCVRPRMKKGIYIVIMKIIRINGASRCDCMQTCLGMRAHCSAFEWHGLHAYSGFSVAHDMCIHARALVRVLVWNRKYVPLLSRPEMRIKLSPSWSRQT